jgi:hypothetical protein
MINCDNDDLCDLYTSFTRPIKLLVIVRRRLTFVSSKRRNLVISGMHNNFCQNEILTARLVHHN